MGVFAQGYVGVIQMEAMDIVAARKLKSVVLNPPPSVDEGIGACEALLDVLEMGSFTEPEMVASLLKQAANVIGDRTNLKVFEGRLAQLVERAEQRPQQLKLEGPWEQVGC